MKISNLKFSSTKLIAPLILAAGMVLACASNVQAVSFNYASTVGSTIDFDGMTHFTFSPVTNNFQVANGSAAGFLGQMTGTFTIGTITTIGGVSTASVSGSGTFVIHDSVSMTDLTATLTWVDITQNGTGDNLNITGTVNLTGITYTGSNADLVALRNAGNGANVLSFQFIPAVTLAELRNGPGPHSTSFSGTVATLPDGGTTVALLGLALTGLEGLRRRMKKAKVRI